MSDWQSDQEYPSNLTPEILVPRLGNYLVEKEIISAQNLEDALTLQKSRGQTGTPVLLGQILIEMGLLDKVTLDRIITEQIIQLRSALQNANEQLEKRVQIRTAELQKALEKLAVLDRMKSNFISNISHELRTPLTHIKGYLDLLLIGDLGELDPDQMDAVRVMSKSSGRLEQLINELIMFSSTEHGKADYRLEEIDLIPVCKYIIQQTIESLAFEHKQIQLIFRWNENEHLFVWADKANITWVIQHFIDNAKKFTSPNGKIYLDIHKDDQYAYIAVEDTGIGIPSSRINEIFEPFHQLDGNSTRKYNGTGLGLALAKNIITGHHSEIKVTSEPNKGSRFEFYLQLSGK